MHEHARRQFVLRGYLVVRRRAHQQADRTFLVAVDRSDKCFGVQEMFGILLQGDTV